MGKNEGKDLTVWFDGRKCIHARRCVLGQPDVFRADSRGKWIFPDSGDAEEVAAVVRSCPSGALRFEYTDGRGEARPPINVIRVTENGPLQVRGDIEMGGKKAPIRAVLCRCGASKNKPFCDNRHRKIDFTATGEVATADEVGELDDAAPLSVGAWKDGPLNVRGPVEIVAASGRCVRRGGKFALCRCGQSSNKPYCDGTHNKVGFEAPESP